MSFICTVLFLFGCQGKILYKDGQLEHFRQQHGVIELRFKTGYGMQSAFYLPPEKEDRSLPDPLVVAYPGITALALGWVEYVRNGTGKEGAGYLLIEYPKRGNSEGSFRPDRLNESSTGALAALAQHLGTTQDIISRNLVFLGHSFGSGVALQYAVENPPKRIVAVAPFNTLKSAALRKIDPLALIIPSNIDNCTNIKKICGSASPPKIFIFHGSNDETLPVAMSRELSLCSQTCLTYYEIAGAGHTDILHSHKLEIMEALFDK